jgi:tRNA threonylcarbamoyladenosine biosynthesis protein TsaB
VAPEGSLVLGIDTSGEELGLGLLRLPEWHVLEELASWRGRGHAEEVLVAALQICARHHIGLADLALLGVARGPGSFTGVRVGLATGLGLGMGLERPVWPVSSLEALALHAAGSPALALPMFDARRGEVDGVLYEVDAAGRPTEIAPPRAGRADQVLEACREAAGSRPILVFGRGAVAYRCASEVPPWWHVPRGIAVAHLAGLAWEDAGRPATAPVPDPLYLRLSEPERALGETAPTRGAGG